MPSLDPQPTRAAPPVLGQAMPVELMCTIWADRHGAYDSLATDEGVSAWLSELGTRAPDGAPPTGRHRTSLQELRDAARRIAAHVTRDSRDRAQPLPSDVREAIATVNRIAATAALPALRIDGEGTVGLADDVRRDPAAFLSALATGIVDFFGSTAAEELRTCEAPGCVLYFVKDHPRREWCSVACGNRARAARHYARHGRQ